MVNGRKVHGGGSLKLFHCIEIVLSFVADEYGLSWLIKELLGFGYFPSGGSCTNEGKRRFGIVFGIFIALCYGN
jgi:hypothetical protein